MPDLADTLNAISKEKHSPRRTRRKAKTVNVLLVSKLQLGNREAEAPASRDWKLELPGLHSQAGAWERVQIFMAAQYPPALELGV